MASFHFGVLWVLVIPTTLWMLEEGRVSTVEVHEFPFCYLICCVDRIFWSKFSVLPISHIGDCINMQTLSTAWQWETLWVIDSSLFLLFTLLLIIYIAGIFSSAFSGMTTPGMGNQPGRFVIPYNFHMTISFTFELLLLLNVLCCAIGFYLLHWHWSHAVIVIW